MKYFIEIEIDEDLFKENTQIEIQRIITECASRISLMSFAHQETRYPIRDINGNRIGYHGYIKEESEY